MSQVQTVRVAVVEENREGLALLSKVKTSTIQNADLILARTSDGTFRVLKDRYNVALPAPSFADKLSERIRQETDPFVRDRLNQVLRDYLAEQ
jgi:hypothetical protein